MTVRDATPHPPAAEDEDDKHRLTALEGLAALSLDALSSVAYGPEAIVIVLAAAGTAGLAYTLPVTIAIVVLLAVLVISYRQVIEAFPGGGGAYAVAKRHLGQQASLLAGASLTVDYVLNAAVGVSAGVEALHVRLPPPVRRPGLALPRRARGDHGGQHVGGGGIRPAVHRAHPGVHPCHRRRHRRRPDPLASRGAPSGHLPVVAESIGILLLLKAFASGCSALTGVEAIANAVPEFKRPRARRAQHTEMMLGVILGLMLIGIAVLIRKFHATPSATETTLAQLAAAAVGKGVAFYAIQLITTVLLALAANTSFGGLPVLASLLARDNFLPHVFALKAERQVFRYGVGVLAAAAAVLLVVSRGSTQALIPVFAIGVFVGFTLSQTGMVRHWHEQHGPGWVRRAFINGLGAVLTTAALAIELVSKFTEGAWLVVIIIPALVLLFTRIHRVYEEIGGLLELGETPPPPERTPALAVVPVRGLSRLTREAISAALSLADEVVAVTICYHDVEDQQADASFRQQWEAVGSGRAADHPAHRAPGARPARRGIPARPGAGGSEPPRRGGDPGGPARALVAVVPA